MHIQNKHRPIPFWSWNDELQTQTTADQVEMMAKAGMGGFFMHARGGLITPYMQEEWFANVDAAVQTAQKYGIDAWAYDENGWPSGFGNGVVNGTGEIFWQKYLRIEEGQGQSERTIDHSHGYHVYYDVNPLYVDTLCREATDLFIETVYMPYAKRYGRKIKGIFTDEPQISRNGIPWSNSLPTAYEKRYGEAIYPHLPLLFHPLPGHEEFRLRFWKLVTDLFSANFMKPIYDYCQSAGLLLTGHLVLEENLHCQLTSNGAAMPHYEYFHMPGMDWLGRRIFPCLTALQVSSVAQQLGKRQVLSETFALCGHNVSFEELRGIYEWQMVRGITLLCTHLEGYTMRGIRKRDYPPALFYQQPWWDDFSLFTDSMSLIGQILSEGEAQVDTLLMHPQSSAWILFDNDKNEGLDGLHQKFLGVIDRLERNQVQFHLGDETILERHAKVENGRLIVGEQSYATVILPPHIRFMENTQRLLDEFARQGGTIIDATKGDDFPVASMDIVDNGNITCAIRKLPQGMLYYLVNSTPTAQSVNINKGTCVIDPISGDFIPFNRSTTIPPYTSLLVLEENDKEYIAPAAPKAAKAMDLSGPWHILSADENALMLDQCRYWFDGELVEDNGWVIDIQDRACALRRPVAIKIEYRFDVLRKPDELFMLCETPEIYNIQINGQSLIQNDLGWRYDTSLRRLAIGDLVVAGENIITMTTNFTQPEHVYECLEKAKVFESEKNKLSYGMEIEPAILLGQFTVNTPGSFTALARNAQRYSGGFALDWGLPAQIEAQDIQTQGFPFFSGRMTLQKKISLSPEETLFAVHKLGTNVMRVRANGGEWHTMMFNPFAVDLAQDIVAGENTIEVELVGNLRNLMGPHHLEEGESYAAGPSSFFRSPSVWNNQRPQKWNDGYCFAQVGFQTKQEGHA